jgi:hypothetical protein
MAKKKKSNKDYINRKIKNCDNLIIEATSNEQKEVYIKYREFWIEKLPKALDPDLIAEKAEASRIKKEKAELRRIENEKRKAEERKQLEIIAEKKKERLRKKAEVIDELETLGIDPQGEINEPETEKADNNKDESGPD